jgi:hypothetical protein
MCVARAGGGILFGLWANAALRAARFANFRVDTYLFDKRGGKGFTLL